MILGHTPHDQLAREFMALALVALGILQLRIPGCFESIPRYFRGTWCGLSDEQSQRLRSVLDARTLAEGSGGIRARYVGVFSIAMAGVSLLPGVPYVMPYAASCLAAAGATLLAYLKFRRATELRVAPLVRRTPLTALPPVMIGSAAVCLIGAAAFSVIPEFRAGVIIVVVSAAALLAIAWRIAVAPAVLLGTDPQVEYAVDDRVRFCRATSLIALACAPAVVFAVLAWSQLPSTGGVLGLVTLLVLVAYVVAMVVSLNPLRQTIRLA